MGKERLGLSRYLSLMMAIFFILVTSCSAPRVVILKDPLTATEHNDLGVAYERRGLQDLAEKEYYKALEKEPGWWLPCFNLGNLFYLNGDYMLAQIYYRRALNLDSTNTDVMNNLANVLHDLGQEKEAMELISKALCVERKPEYLDTYRKLFGTFQEEGGKPLVLQPESD